MTEIKKLWELYIAKVKENLSLQELANIEHAYYAGMANLMYSQLDLMDIEQTNEELSEVMSTWLDEIEANLANFELISDMTNILKH